MITTLFDRYEIDFVFHLVFDFIFCVLHFVFAYANKSFAYYCSSLDIHHFFKNRLNSSEYYIIKGNIILKKMSLSEINIKGVEDTTQREKGREEKPKSYYLPKEIWRLIYSFDPTYRRIHFQKILKDLKVSTAFWRKTFIPVANLSSRKMFETYNRMHGGLDYYKSDYDSCLNECRVMEGEYNHNCRITNSIAILRLKVLPSCLFDNVGGYYRLVFDRIERRKFWGK